MQWLQLPCHHQGSSQEASPGQHQAPETPRRGSLLPLAHGRLCQQRALQGGVKAQQESALILAVFQVVVHGLVCNGPDIVFLGDGCQGTVVAPSRGQHAQSLHSQAAFSSRASSSESWVSSLFTSPPALHAVTTLGIHLLAVNHLCLVNSSH